MLQNNAVDSDNFYRIPEAIRSKNNWLLWQFIPQPSGKPRKVPIYLDGQWRRGTQGTEYDRKRLASFPEVIARYNRGGVNGLGFATLPDADITALDFDNCIIDGLINPEVLDLVSYTYYELSPSGTGVRAFFMGEMPDAKFNKDPNTWDVEFFHRKGFVTTTGNVPELARLQNPDSRIIPVTNKIRQLYKQRSEGRSLPASRSEIFINKPKVGLSGEQIKDLLTKADPDSDYDSWLKIGMGLHHESNGAEWGLDLWNEFSSKGTKYPGDRELLHKWQSFNKNETSNQVTMRSIQRMVAVNQAAKDGKTIIPSKYPIDLAKSILDIKYHNGENSLLIRSQGSWQQYKNSCYVEPSEEVIRSTAWKHLSDCCMIKNSKTIPYNPSVADVSGTLDALKALTQNPDINAPCWLQGVKGPDPQEIAVLQNGLFHIPSRQLLKHTPDFYSHNILPYAWEPSVQIPEWLKFLNQIWCDDNESINTLQEIFGYLLTPDTRQQKIFLLIGPRRSGKGTIGRILQSLLGSENTIGPTLSSMTGQFGLESFIGKLCAVIPDARVGYNSNTHLMTERLLMISGEDSVTVDRKNKTSWTGKLPTRLVMLSNETPYLGDPSGALSGRFIILSMNQSFYGKEDTGLLERLLTEVPGIFKWALNGRDRLRERGFFVQPISARNRIEELQRITSPISSFVSDLCELGSEYSIDKDGLFAAWKKWCEDSNRGHAGNKDNFFKQLSAAHQLNPSRPREGDARIQKVIGIRLKHGQEPNY